MFKNTMQILLGVALAVQLTGCFFVGHDDRWHHEHEHHDHDGAIDVHLHG